jgi:Protein of unknown function (DUF3800)
MNLAIAVPFQWSIEERKSRPNSILGKFFPNAFIPQGNLLIVLKSYFDKSGGENQAFLTLGGIAANDDIWAEIETTWNYILQKRSLIPARYMHMTEALGLKREFDEEKGWNDENIFGLINLLVSYITQIPKENYCQFFCTIDMAAYERLISENYQMDSPVDICNTYCVEGVMRWHMLEYKSLDIQSSFYFDRGEPFEPIFKAKWEREKNADRELGNHSPWSCVVHVGTVEMQTTPGLQIADMLAWGYNREKTGGDRFQHIALTLRSIMPTKGFLWDEQHLRERYKPLIYRP